VGLRGPEIAASGCILIATLTWQLCVFGFLSLIAFVTMSTVAPMTDRNGAWFAPFATMRSWAAMSSRRAWGSFHELAEKGLFTGRQAGALFPHPRPPGRAPVRAGVKRAVECNSIRRIANQREQMASRIHAVQTAAYRQEASLLDIRDFPPLDRTVEDIMASSDSFFGAFDGEELLGVISLEQRNENEVSISSLTVAPPFQRLGVAKALVAYTAGWVKSQKLSVSTAAKNAPALALYEQLGFVECERTFVGEEQLEVIRLVAERFNYSSGA